MGYTALSQIFDQKRDCSQHWLCFAISDGKKRLFQVLQYGEIILQKLEEETQGQTIVFTSISQIMEFVLTSKCVGVISEWFH